MDFWRDGLEKYDLDLIGLGGENPEFLESNCKTEEEWLEEPWFNDGN